MGNRAMILPKGSDIGVYLHWNGGPDSVGAFLEYCKLRGFRDFGGKNRDSYGLARFVQVVGNFLGGSLSIGIEHCSGTEEEAKAFDNGIYIVDGWEIVNHIGVKYREGYDRKDMMIFIDESQPYSEQLGREFFDAKLVSIYELEVGDEVFVRTFEEKICRHKVVGIAPGGTWKNGRDLSYVPYVDLYSYNGGYSQNINNYVSLYADNNMIRRV